MGIPLIQQLRIGGYLIKQKLKGRERYPLAMMLEPLFQCNLAVLGLRQDRSPRRDPQEAPQRRRGAAAVDECGAPVVSIPGGEPLLHDEMPEIVKGSWRARSSFISAPTPCCSRARWTTTSRPLPQLLGPPRRQPGAPRRVGLPEGVYDRAVAAIKQALDRGFRVTINCTLFNGEDPDEVASSSTMSWRWGRGHHDLTRLQLQPRTASGRLPEPAREQAALPRDLQARRRTQEEVGVQPVIALSRFPRRQPGLPVHPVVEPDLQRLRLAETLLSAGG